MIYNFDYRAKKTVLSVGAILLREGLRQRESPLLPFGWIIEMQLVLMPR